MDVFIVLTNEEDSDKSIIGVRSTWDLAVELARTWDPEWEVGREYESGIYIIEETLK